MGRGRGMPPTKRLHFDGALPRRAPQYGRGRGTPKGQSKNTPIKCLWCGGSHPSFNCPNRGSAGSDNSRKRALGSFASDFAGALWHNDDSYEYTPDDESVNSDDGVYFDEQFTYPVPEKVDDLTVPIEQRHIRFCDDYNKSKHLEQDDPTQQCPCCVTTDIAYMVKDNPKHVTFEDDIKEDTFEDPEHLCFNMERMKGLGILDGGATKTAGGIDQLEYLQQQYMEKKGQDVTVNPSTVEFTFAGGEREPAGSEVTFQVEALDDYPMKFHCVKTPTPILIGLDVHRDLGLVVDFHYKTAYSYAMNKFIEIVTLPSGHMALDLTPKE